MTINEDFSKDILPNVDLPKDEKKDESKKPEIQNKNISKTELITKEVNSILDNGIIELVDKPSKLKLNNQVRDNLKLSKGWSSDINKIIKKIAEDKKLKISDLGFKNDKIGDVTVNLINEPEKTETKIQSNIQNPHTALSQTTGENPHGTMPKGFGTETKTEETKPEIKIMSEDAQAKLIKKGLNDIIAPLYISLGIVEPDEQEKKDEAKLPTAKKFKKDMDDLGDDINDYLKENDIRLPAFLNHLAILLSIFMVLVLPVIKFKFFSTKQEPDPEFDKTADDIEVKV